jgi:thiol-disulfide isomerase/thioredoxin
MAASFKDYQMSQVQPAPAPRSSAFLRLAGPLMFITILAGGSLYAFGGLDKVFRISGGENTACAAAAPLTARLKPLATGEIAALQVAEKPAPALDVTFLNPQGVPVRLSDFKGKTVLLNLWATWCAPCRKEMPALDALQAALGGTDFEVVAVNIDTRNFEKPKQFLSEINVSRLAYYADPAAKIFTDMKGAGKAFGMPTTLLIDKNGCELANLAGPAEWASPEALACVKANLGR